MQDTFWPKPGVISAVLWLLVEDCYRMHKLQYAGRRLLSHAQIAITNHTNIVTGLPTLLIDYTALCMSQNLIFLKVESMT